MSEKFSNVQFAICKNDVSANLCAIPVYTPPISATDSKPETIPIIIPSTKNGHLIKLFVAPTYFIIEISFLLECTANFIVFVIIDTDIIINNINIPPVTILTPLARLIICDIT